MLEITQHPLSSGLLWMLKGRLDGAGSIEFDRLAHAIEEPIRHVVLDFGGVDFLSSAGVRELIKLGRALKSRDGTLMLSALTPFVAQVLDVAGLTEHFAIAQTADEAAARLQAGHETESAREESVNGHSYMVRRDAAEQFPLREWGSFESQFAAAGVALPHITASLAELGCAVGLGGLGFDREQAEAAHGYFISTGQLLAVQPADGSGVPDFLHAARPDETIFHLSCALSLTGAPAMSLSATETSTLENVYRDMLALAGQPDLMAFLLTATSDNPCGRYFATTEDLHNAQTTAREENEPRTMFYIGVASRTPQGWPDHLLPTLDDYHVMGCGCWFKELNPVPNTSHEDALKHIAGLEQLCAVGGLMLHTPARDISAWVFLPGVVESATAKRLDITVHDGDPLPDEWDAIARRIYNDASRVELARLSGGYSATTFQAISYDMDGRRQLPTILKISSLDFTEREAEAYHRYVEKFILNNSTVIMGRATRGHWAGLRYNFIGITGPSSRIEWLTHHYRKRPVEELDPIFEHLFDRILHPWYGQARMEPVALYDEHDPTHLFKGLLADAEKGMGISPEQKTIWCEPLDTELPNPYHVLQHVYAERANQTRPWFRAITHGDLNMQNILLDEKENLYVIDFSETRPRNVYADFARLEPIFKFEMTADPDRDELARLLRFEEALLQVETVDETPPCRYDGTDPMVFKAHHMLSLMRKLACRYTPGHTDLAPYLLALLEWTYPVICYAQLGEMKKQHAMFSTALIVRRLLELTG